MKKLYTSLTLILLFASFSFGQSVIGTWKNIDDKDGKEKSLIEVYEENGKLYGKVVKLLPGASISTCEKCKGDRKNQPIEGMVIMWDLEKDGKQYSDGEIIDPASGKIYSCFIELAEANKLEVRGYMGFSLLGRSQYWIRAE